MVLFVSTPRLLILLLISCVLLCDSVKNKATSTTTPTRGQKIDLRKKKPTPRSSPSRSKNIDSLLFPKLLPHPDTCYLLEFHHDGCDHAEQMEPVLKRLEDDLDTSVRRINISRRKEFFTLLSAVGHDECGSFPFYYNRRTGQAICGATSYSNLRTWGMGEIGHMFHEPPENMHDRENRGSGRKHEVGIKGFFSEKMSRQPKKAASKAKQGKQAATPASEAKESKKDKKVSVQQPKTKQPEAKSKSSASASAAASAPKVKSAAVARMEERRARREAKRQLTSSGK